MLALFPWRSPCVFLWEVEFGPPGNSVQNDLIFHSKTISLCALSLLSAGTGTIFTAIAKGGSTLEDGARAIAAVGSEDVVVAGYLGNTIGDMFAVKLNGTNGNEVWTWQVRRNPSKL